MGKIIKISSTFIRLDSWYFFLLTSCITLLLPFFVGFNHLTLLETARIVERLFTLLGCALFLPLFTPEADESIFQLVKTKKVPIYQVFIIRLVLILFSIALLLTIHLFMLQKSDSEIDFFLYFVVEFSTILFLGGVLSLSYAIFRQITLGLLFPIFYYSLCLFIGDSYKYLGNLYLFRFSRFNDSTDRWWFFLLGGLMLISSIWIRCQRKTT